MSTQREMPKYSCHKEIWALKIAEIIDDPQIGICFQPVEADYDKIPLSIEYMRKHLPEAGGYYVVYPDGYKSYSPAKVFEDGYSRM